ncbi:MAG: glycosyltransferase [Candidatus Sumerlaeales bacterium]|nr:glycosyltransferase [Candidatus Sumerlaeales bacterium]
MKPRILHLYKDYYPPVFGGIEQTINRMANGLKNDFDVSVLVCAGAEKRGIVDIDGVRVIRTKEMGRFASAPLSTDFIRMLLKEIKSADLIHLHHPNPTSDFALALSGFHSKPAVMTYHSDIVRQKFSRILVAPFLRHSMDHCSVIMPTSPDYAESSQWLQKYKHKLEVIPLGINIDEWQETAESRVFSESIRQQANGRHIICFNGRLRYYKGLPWLIEAMKSIPDIILFISGDGPMRPEIENQIATLSLSDSVRLIGSLSHSDLVGLLHASELFCMPSHLRSEALGISMIEAMACHLPIVSCDIPTGVRYVNIDGKTGLRVPPSNAAALADAIRRITQDTALAKQFAIAAHKRATEFFSEDVMNRHLEQVYVKALHIN